jgi:hypothetical protein
MRAATQVDLTSLHARLELCCGLAKTSSAAADSLLHSALSASAGSQHYCRWHLTIVKILVVSNHIAATSCRITRVGCGSSAVPLERLYLSSTASALKFQRTSMLHAVL